VGLRYRSAWWKLFTRDRNHVHRLLPEDWDKFLTLPAGTKFKVSSQNWQKITSADLELLNGKCLWPLPAIGDGQDVRY
jgi:hypothetical protein